jgi:hypothetical protein
MNLENQQDVQQAELVTTAVRDVIDKDTFSRALDRNFGVCNIRDVLCYFVGLFNRRWAISNWAIHCPRVNLAL